jgi:hypothetical protein
MQGLRARRWARGDAPGPPRISGMNFHEFCPNNDKVWGIRAVRAQVDVTLTDLPEVVPALAANAARNKTLANLLHAAPLDWSHAERDVAALTPLLQRGDTLPSRDLVTSVPTATSGDDPARQASEGTARDDVGQGQRGFCTVVSACAAVPESVAAAAVEACAGARLQGRQVAVVASAGRHDAPCDPESELEGGQSRGTEVTWSKVRVGMATGFAVADGQDDDSRAAAKHTGDGVATGGTEALVGKGNAESTDATEDAQVAREDVARDRPSGLRAVSEHVVDRLPRAGESLQSTAGAASAACDGEHRDCGAGSVLPWGSGTQAVYLLLAADCVWVAGLVHPFLEALRCLCAGLHGKACVKILVAYKSRSKQVDWLLFQGLREWCSIEQVAVLAGEARGSIELWLASPN